ncbi:MAG: hypothetical protein WC588_01320 [Candidatus Micrarchaeia archaeon]
MQNLQKAPLAQKPLPARHGFFNKLDGLLHLAALADEGILKTARVQPFELIPYDELPFQIADPKRDYPLLVRTSTPAGKDETPIMWADQPRHKFSPYRMDETPQERKTRVDFTMRIYNWLSNIGPLEIILHRLPNTEYSHIGAITFNPIYGRCSFFIAEYTSTTSFSETFRNHFASINMPFSMGKEYEKRNVMAGNYSKMGFLLTGKKMDDSLIGSVENAAYAIRGHLMGKSEVSFVIYRGETVPVLYDWLLTD